MLLGWLQSASYVTVQDLMPLRSSTEIPSKLKSSRSARSRQYHQALRPLTLSQRKSTQNYTRRYGQKLLNRTLKARSRLQLQHPRRHHHLMEAPFLHWPVAPRLHRLRRHRHAVVVHCPIFPAVRSLLLQLRLNCSPLPLKQNRTLLNRSREYLKAEMQQVMMRMKQLQCRPNYPKPLFDVQRDLEKPHEKYRTSLRRPATVAVRGTLLPLLPRRALRLSVPLLVRLRLQMPSFRLHVNHVHHQWHLPGAAGSMCLLKLPLCDKVRIHRPRRLQQVHPQWPFLPLKCLLLLHSCRSSDQAAHTYNTTAPLLQKSVTSSLATSTHG